MLYLAGTHEGKGLENQFLASVNARSVDALAHVVRCFDPIELKQIQLLLHTIRLFSRLDIEKTRKSDLRFQIESNHHDNLPRDLLKILGIY